MRYIDEVEKIRKAYFMQLIFCLLAFFILCVALFLYKDFDFLFVIFLVCLVLFAIQVYESINEAFQMAVDTELGFKVKKMFDGMQYDVEKGVEENVLNKITNVAQFQKKESFCVLGNDEFKLSEEFLYNEKTILGFNFKKTKFRGIVFSIYNVDADIKGEIFNDGREFGLNIDDNKKRDELKKSLIKLMAILGAKKCFFEKFEENLYIFFETDKKILYQFFICKKININLFASRISIIGNNVREFINRVKIGFIHNLGEKI